MNNQKFCILDFETYSEVELKEHGSYVYAQSPTTRILCASWMIDTMDNLLKAMELGIKPYVSRDASEIRKYLEDTARDSSIIFVAHNAQFERNILKYCLGASSRLLDLKRWRCTMAMAMAVGLPRSLDQVTEVLNLPIKKDLEGSNLMKKISKPSHTKNNSDKLQLHTDANLNRLAEYCRVDVQAEVWVFLTLPQLIESEQLIWEMDQEINDRGMLIDSQLVENSYNLLQTEVHNAELRVQDITGGEVVSAREVKKFSEYLKNFGVEIPNLTKDTVTKYVEEQTFADIPEVQELMELRQLASKSSTAKFEAFLNYKCEDNRVRGSLLYHAASTGRWGGAGVQPQNLPRPQLSQKLIDSMVEVVKENPGYTNQWVESVDHNTLSCFSSLLRSAIIADTGRILDVADFNAIELRVAYWLAGYEKGLDDFRNGRPMYEEMAQKIFNIPDIKSVNEAQRFVGKTVRLGCIYGMGAAKLDDTFKKQKKEFGADFAKLCIDIFRREHGHIVKMWHDYEQAAIEAIKYPNKEYFTNKVTWIYDGFFLNCRLPSGRSVRYPFAELRWEVPKYGGEKKLTIFYKGVSTQTKKWVDKQTYGGKLTENISQALAREVMAHSMLRVKNAGHWKMVLSVHDELISERDENSAANLKMYESVLSESPNWASDLPLKAKGYSAKRYKK